MKEKKKLKSHGRILQGNYLIGLALVMCLSACATPNYKPAPEFVYQPQDSAASCIDLQREIDELSGRGGDPNERANEVAALGAVSALGAMASGAVAFTILPIGIGGGIVGAIYNRIYEKEHALRKERVDYLSVLLQNKKCEGTTSSKPVSIISASEIPFDADLTQALVVPEPEVLEFPSRCTNAADHNKRLYIVRINGVAETEKLKFFTRGRQANNRVISVSSLMLGEVKLPSLVISSRKGARDYGLWVERIETGEQQQLNYLPPKMSCDVNGRLRVKYTDIWVTAELIKYKK